MLFSIKKRLLPTMFLSLVLVIGAVVLRDSIGQSWDLAMRSGFFSVLLVGVAAIFACDVLLHCILWFLLGDRYLHGYRTLVEYFRPQTVPVILASGLLAATEEFVFRGVILTGLLEVLGFGIISAVLVSAFIFGVFHLIWNQHLAIFGLWAVWEGVMLGFIFVLSSSLLISAIIHAIHDVVCFIFFAFQRRTEFLL